MECSFCGKPVEPTIHQKDGDPPYQVGYYRLLTGKLHHRIMKDPRNESETIEFYYLSDPRWVLTCDRCIQKPEVANDLDELFSGLPEVVEDQTLEEPPAN